MKVELVAYSITWLSSLLIIWLDYQRYVKNIKRQPEGNFSEDDRYIYKIHMGTIIFVALIWVGFNIFITTLHPVMGDDWVNYSVNFSGTRESPSIGLNFLIKFCRGHGGTMYTLSRFSTFICMVITLYAYRKSKIATPLCFVFLFLTQYSFLTIALLKQTFTNALASLFLILSIQRKTKQTDLICVCLLILACLFHPSGYVLVPMFIILRQPKTTKNVSLFLLMMVLMAFFFKPMMIFMGKTLAPIVPSIGLKITQYFNESNLRDEGLSYSVFKSIPETCILLLGLYKRKTLINRIDNYDNYLLVCATGVFLYHMSVYSGWMYRMIYLFHFPIFVLLNGIINNLQLKTNRQVITISLALMLGVIMYRFLYISFT